MIDLLFGSQATETTLFAIWEEAEQPPFEYDPITFTLTASKTSTGKALADKQFNFAVFHNGKQVAIPELPTGGITFHNVFDTSYMPPTGEELSLAWALPLIASIAATVLGVTRSTIKRRCDA